MDKTTILDYLTKFYGNDCSDEAEIALYWFANDYHSGQASELYSILSTSPYKPSCLARGIESEGGMAEIMYDDLCCLFNVNPK